jgi:hypothetical protein
MLRDIGIAEFVLSIHTVPCVHSLIVWVGSTLFRVLQDVIHLLRPYGSNVVVDFAECLAFPEIAVGCVIHSMIWVFSNTPSDSERYLITRSGSLRPAAAWLDSDCGL